MLRSCEQESANWWESNCVIDIFSQLFERLMANIEKKDLRNYFIPDSNLLNFRMSRSAYTEQVEVLKVSCDRLDLSHWFMANYLS